jgi:broad specificity polyphosphatase/5'/3'-nucleotidase SurE
MRMLVTNDDRIASPGLHGIGTVELAGTEHIA